MNKGICMCMHACLHVCVNMCMHVRQGRIYCLSNKLVTLSLNLIHWKSLKVILSHFKYVGPPFCFCTFAFFGITGTANVVLVGNAGNGVLGNQLFHHHCCPTTCDWGSGMFRNLTKLPDKAGRQDLDGVRVVEHDTNFGGPLVLTHRLP